MDNEIKSIWDGWEKQCFGASTGHGGSMCATGFTMLQPKWSVVRLVLERVGKYIREAHEIPEHFDIADGIGGTRDGKRSDPGDVVIYANDYLKFTPEQFREIDRLTQVEEATRALIESVEPASHPATAEVGVEA